MMNPLLYSIFQKQICSSGQLPKWDNKPLQAVSPRTGSVVSPSPVMEVMLYGANLRSYRGLFSLTFGVGVQEERQD